jgi:sigma54-dependent transcription regulator
MNFELIYAAIRTWAEVRGISVRQARLGAKKAGEFDGLSATMNSRYGAEERCYYLVHAVGSMVRWSVSFSKISEIFAELRAAKKHSRENSAQLESAIERYRSFEIESSELAVWLLGELGKREAIPAYTNFMRADLEALTQFHREGVSPVWRDFFAQWNDDVRRGHRIVEPLQPKPIPDFTPTLIEKQEILQKQPERSDASA